MSTLIFAGALTVIFAFIGGIHFYWALGGKWGFSVALPTNAEGERQMSPKPLLTAVVGFGLMLFGVFYLMFTDFLPALLPESWIAVIGWILPGIFFLRGVGDFKYAGLFKKVKNTQFATYDTYLFSPLCLVIATLGILVQLYH